MELITPDSDLSRSSALVKLHAVKRHQRLAIILPSGRELAEVLLFCFERQIVAVPIDPKTPQYRQHFIVGHSQSKHVYSNEGLHTIPGSFSVSPPDDRFLIYTSGSTGDPKGVVLTEDAVIHNARATADLHGITEGEPHATLLPLYHCNALIMSLMGCYLYESKLVLFNDFDAAHFFASLTRESVRTASLVPALLERVVEAKLPWPSRLRYFITAASALSRDLAFRFFGLYGPRLRQGYGLTEAVNFSFVMPELDVADFHREYLFSFPPVGLTLSGTEARIRGGEVQVRGPNLMREYWRNPVATALSFTRDGWLRTGDIGKWRNEFLVIKGRIKEVINRGGETIYPAEVEEEWSRFGLEQPFAAVGTADDGGLGENVGLCIEQANLDVLARLASSVRRRPAAVQMGPLMLTATGKPKRSRMGELLCSHCEAGERYAKLLSSATSIAEHIVTSTVNPHRLHGSARFIWEFSKRLVGSGISGGTSPDSERVWLRALEILKAAWPIVLAGEGTGELLVKGYPGLWTELMCEWPMGIYASMTAKLLLQRNLVTGAVVELGAGVGNASRLIRNTVSDKYIRTDLHPELCKQLAMPGRIERYDFNEVSYYANIDTVFSVNALHCANDKIKTLGFVYEMLKPGGVFVMAEGSPTTKNTLPWALTGFFGLFRGWWDQGGFQERRFWLEALSNAGFRNLGYSQFRAGDHDLGGVVWGER